MASDPAILNLLADGRSMEAFELLLGAYQDKVFRLACSMLGERGQAEDAAQETFLRIWKSLAKYRGDSALGTWIYSIVRNVCLTAIARRASQAVAPFDERFLTHTPTGGGGQPDVLRYVGRLPDVQRRVVTLYYMEERTYEEVARLLDLPLGTVKTHLHRARKQLALMLTKEHK